jgi:hypothetical protein
LLSGQQPGISSEGLDLSRYTPRRIATHMPVVAPTSA